MNITLKWYEDSENGEIEIEEEFPAKMEVCPDCKGEGSVLIPSIRNYAFSQEEFEESFCDEEDRRAYFEPHSKYHEMCSTCRGQNVVPVVDEDHLSAPQKEMYAKYCVYEEERQRGESEDRMTRYYESGGLDC